ncbi:MAG TPA: PP2C family protein-serine/threonine phosphatase [Bacteroidales bacterium]|nr:PP2C family protein-serine/threonine phosphatase [Bacteroidales bacterium]
MDNKASRNRLQMSRFKLDSLLDITMSINANLSIEELLAKYERILREELNIGKILIYMFSEEWKCLLNAGFSGEFAAGIDPEAALTQFEERTIVTQEEKSVFPDVDIILPVFNNNVPLAYVLIGDIDEEGEGMSPVLKHIRFIQTISSIIIVAIENIRLFDESLRQEALKKELELAARMQTMLIPDNISLHQTKHIKVTGYYHPHYDVGGDYYDCISLGENITGLCIADVSGKGISAALLMSNFQASFRALFSADIGLGVLIHKLNDIVVQNASGEKFITFFVARYNHDSRELEYINAAHNPPVLFDIVTGEINYLEASSVGIGMLDVIPTINTSIVKIVNPTKLVCYTDGLSELKGEDGKDIGTAPIIKHISNMKPIDQNIKALIRDLGIPDNNPHLFDDVSIIAAVLS